MKCIWVLRTFDHLFNLEHNYNVTLLSAGRELKGTAHIMATSAPGLNLGFLREPAAEWCVLVRK